MTLDDHAYLDGHTVVPCDWDTYVTAYRTNRKPWRVAETTIPDKHWISTVFLGNDHSFGFGREPLWFETMVFGLTADGQPDYHEIDCERYTTWEEAEAGHSRLVAKYSKEDES